jgi:hypothetical protein
MSNSIQIYKGLKLQKAKCHNSFIYSDCVNKTKKCLIKNEWIELKLQLFHLFRFCENVKNSICK